jgi:amidase
VGSVHQDAANALNARIGVVRANFGGRNDLVSAVVEEALKVLKAKGAILIDPVELPNAGKYSQSELEVLLYELKADLAAYFAEFAPGSSIRTLQRGCRLSAARGASLR